MNPKKVTLSDGASPYYPLWGLPRVKGVNLWIGLTLYCYRLTLNNFGTCKKLREYNLSYMIYVFDTYV